MKTLFINMLALGLAGCATLSPDSAYQAGMHDTFAMLAILLVAVLVLLAVLLIQPGVTVDLRGLGKDIKATREHLYQLGQREKIEEAIFEAEQVRRMYQRQGWPPDPAQPVDDVINRLKHDLFVQTLDGRVCENQRKRL